MVDLALIQLDERRVGGLSASTRRDGITVRSAFVEALPRPSAEMTPEELKEIFKRNGFTASRAMLVVPRRYALVRELSVPNGSPEEVGSMIRFQLSKELPMPVEQVRYSLHEVERTAEKQKLLALVVPETVYGLLTGTLEKAGVRVSAAYVSTEGLAALVPGAKEAVAAAQLGGDSLEVLVTLNETIRLTSNISIDKMSDAEIGEQLNRALMSYLARSPDHQVARILMSEPRRGIAEKLMKGTEVVALDCAPAVDGEAVPAELSAAAGIGVALARRPAAMPGLQRPPEPQKKFELKKSLRIGGLAAAVGVLAIIYLAMSASDQETRLENSRREIADKTKKLESVRKLRKEKELADRWASARPLWPETLLELSNLMDTRNAYLMSATLEDDQSMTLVGRAKSREDVTKLVQKFEESKGIQNVNATSMSDTNDKLGFGVEFTIKAWVEP